MSDLKQKTPPAIATFSTPAYQTNRVAGNRDELAEVAEDPRERLNWAGALLRLPDVWRDSQGSGIKVAVLDTGVDRDHPDLQSAIVGMEDFTGDGIEDVNGHGTHCAGIIAARYNGVGFVGAAPQSELLIAKVLGNDGSGSYSWISDGINWAVDEGADIISMSLGGPVSDAQLFTAVHSALLQGVMVICAAGNDGSVFRNSIDYPGKYGAVITVASHDHNGNASGFSSRGGELDFMAPGSDIWSTYKEGTWASLSGTSMATPFVSGVAALILSKHRNYDHNNTPIENNEDLRNHLMEMAAHPGYHNNERGYGPLLPFNYFS